MDLNEWTHHYISSRYYGMSDKMLTDQKINFIHENKAYTFEITDTLPDTPPTLYSKLTNYCLVTLNTAKNVDTIIRQFTKYSQNMFLTIIFVNPSTNQKWLLKPHVHSIIADKSSLKRGILSLYETVPPV